MSEYKLFAQRIGLTWIISVIVGLKGLILLPILTKTLGTELYGVWNQILVTVYLLAPFAVLQLDTAFIRYTAGETNVDNIRGNFYLVFTAVSTFSFLLSILVFIFSKPIAFTFFGGENSIIFVKLLSILTFLIALETICIQFFKTFQQMKKYSGLLILQEILEILLVSYTVLAGYSLFGVLLSLIIIKFFLFLVSLFFIYSQIGIGYPDISVIKPYLNFSLPIVPSVLFGWIVTLSDRYIIAYFIGVASVGIYSAAYNIGSTVSMFMDPIGTNLFPMISNLYRDNKLDNLKIYLKYSLKLYLMLAIPSLFGLTVLSKSILVTLATSEFLAAYLIVPIVAFGVILSASAGIFSYILMLLKRTRMIAIMGGIAALMNIILNLILVPVIGIMGAAIATLMTYLIYALALFIISFKELPFNIDWKFISKSILSSIIMAFIIWNLNSYGALNLLISIGIAVLVYFGTLVLLRGFMKEEYRFLKGLFKI